MQLVVVQLPLVFRPVAPERRATHEDRDPKPCTNLCCLVALFWVIRPDRLI